MSFLLHFSLSTFNIVVYVYPLNLCNQFHTQAQIILSSVKIERGVVGDNNMRIKMIKIQMLTV